MLRQLKLLSTLPFRFLCSRRGLVLENLALRQQLTVLTRRRPSDDHRLCDQEQRRIVVAGTVSGIQAHDAPLNVFRSDGAVPIDNNASEREIPSKLNFSA